MEKVKVIPRIIDDGAGFVLCFPERPAVEGTIMCWTLEDGHQQLSYANAYMLGAPPRSNYQVKRFLEMMDQYRAMYQQEPVEQTRWSLEQRKMAWGLK